MKKSLRNILKKLMPVRELILGLLLVGLFVSTIYAFNFEKEKLKRTNKSPFLNPRVSSTSTMDNQKKNASQKENNKQTKEKEKTNKKQEKKEKKTKKTRKIIKKKIIRYPSSSSSQDIEEKRGKEENLSQVQIIIANGSRAGSYQVDFKKGKNIFSIMKKAKRDYGLNFDYDSYSFGKMITRIGNLKADSKHWWHLYHNNRSSNVGVSDLYPKNSDTITWQYENIQSY